jgi:hypothetical protein
LATVFTGAFTIALTAGLAGNFEDTLAGTFAANLTAALGADGAFLVTAFAAGLGANTCLATMGFVKDIVVVVSTAFVAFSVVIMVATPVI